MRISDWSSDVCSSDLLEQAGIADLCAADMRWIDLRRRALAFLGLVTPAEQPAAHQKKIQPAGERHRNTDGRDLENAEARSEERRVGKEWVRPGRSRWSPYH